VRRAGILLDVRSVAHGGQPGDLRRACIAWVNTLADIGLSLWQILPLNPVDGVGSPYASRAANAIEPSLHSALAGDIMVTAPEVTSALESQPWLRRFAVYEALREVHGAPWTVWPPEIRSAGAGLDVVVDEARLHHHAAVQVALGRAWRAVQSAAMEAEVLIVGDMPLYVAEDSVDVWSAPHLFELDEDGRAKQRAGVPPDMFSETGQLWGNPVYAWSAHVDEGFAWWHQRVSRLAELVNVIRLDHFIGLVRAWSIPGDAPDARTGEWIDVPGAALMAALDDIEVTFIAEDLGLVTPAVNQLRNERNLLGMAIHQFGFSDDAYAPHTPSHTPEDVVAYPGTHDNDTVLGWWNDADETTQQRAVAAGVEPSAPVRSLLQMGLACPARWYIASLQDVHGLGTEARMNVPSTVGAHNWSWRATEGHMCREAVSWFGEVAAAHGRR